MGLDVTAYPEARPYDGEIPRDESGKPTDEWWDTADELRLVHTFAYEGFEQSLRGLEDDGWVAVCGEPLRFRAGSYSGYNRFRAALCRVALGVDVSAVWNDPDAYRDRPFFELIHFADNEGTIGPEAAADLARDFEEQRETVIPRWDPANQDEAWYREKYDDWQRAFEIAAGSGLVELC